MSRIREAIELCLEDEPTGDLEFVGVQRVRISA
jgi:hypothetical protein